MLNNMRHRHVDRRGPGTRVEIFDMMPVTEQLSLRSPLRHDPVPPHRHQVKVWLRPTSHDTSHSGVTEPPRPRGTCQEPGDVGRMLGRTNRAIPRGKVLVQRVRTIPPNKQAARGWKAARHSLRWSVSCHDSGGRVVRHLKSHQNPYQLAAASPVALRRLPEDQEGPEP